MYSYSAGEVTKYRTGFLSGFWPRGITVRFNGIMRGKVVHFFRKAKHMQAWWSRNILIDESLAA